MSITSYSTLKTQVFAFSGRDDLSASFDTIVQGAEQHMYHNPDQPLRVQELISTTTITTVAGTNSLALPSGYLGALSALMVVGGEERELNITSPTALQRNGESGVPSYIAIDDAIKFDYTPDGAYDIKLTYYAKPSALDATNSTNTILTNYPFIYLYGCLSIVNELSGEDQDAENYYQKMMRAIKGAIRSSRKKRFNPGTTAQNRTWTP